MGYTELQGTNVPVRMWTTKLTPNEQGAQVEQAAEQQLRNVASMPCIHHHLAVMPDVHWGNGATVGSVIPTVGAIIPAAVGVDIGCGMMATELNLTHDMLPDNLSGIREAIEAAVPHGRTNNGKAASDRGAWGDVPTDVGNVWREALSRRFDIICEKRPRLARSNSVHHLGTLGTGNHFIELCVDNLGLVWVMLHSGSRGVGNAIGSQFISEAKEYCHQIGAALPDRELAYLPEHYPAFPDYIEALTWAQDFASWNRKIMMQRVLGALRTALEPSLGAKNKLWSTRDVYNCHHNYVARERHFGQDVWLTRKGAIRAGAGDYGIIPGSMGARSFIVSGKGNPDSFESCSHGAGRKMSRSEAKRRFTVQDHIMATLSIECRKDAGVVDETPMAYKDIDEVMASQADLVKIERVLSQVVCVKG